MAKKDNVKKEKPAEETVETPEVPEQPVPETEEPVQPAPEEPKEPAVDWQKKYEEAHDAHLRLAADYDNYRKRTVKEKDQAYGHGKADAIAKLLPIYDNLERALNQETQDAAYKKGVEMTMTELVKIFTGLGVEIYGNPGDTFDPNLHNAVMHTEDENLGENVISAVFQKGFKLGDKIVRFAMVQVAN